MSMLATLPQAYALLYVQIISNDFVFKLINHKYVIYPSLNYTTFAWNIFWSINE